MKHRPLDLDLRDLQMIAARARVADEIAAAAAPPADDWERRIAQARAAVAPAEARGFWFVPGKGAWRIVPITDADLGVVNDQMPESH